MRSHSCLLANSGSDRAETGIPSLSPHARDLLCPREAGDPPCDLEFLLRLPHHYRPVGRRSVPLWEAGSGTTSPACFLYFISHLRVTLQLEVPPKTFGKSEF